MKNKISIFQYNEKHRDVHEARADLAEAEEEFAKAEQCQIMDNCLNCNGVGEIEDGTGDPAHNPCQDILHIDCPDCEGKGYIE